MESLISHFLISRMRTATVRNSGLRPRLSKEENQICLFGSLFQILCALKELHIVRILFIRRHTPPSSHLVYLYVAMFASRFTTSRCANPYKRYLSLRPRCNVRYFNWSISSHIPFHSFRCRWFLMLKMVDSGECPKEEVDALRKMYTVRCLSLSRSRAGRMINGFSPRMSCA